MELRTRTGRLVTAQTHYFCDGHGYAHRKTAAMLVRERTELCWFCARGTAPGHVHVARPKEVAA